MKLVCGAVGSTVLTVLPHTSATAAAVLIDGASNNWIGNADDVGMIQVTADTANAHVGGTLLHAQTSAQIKAASEGAVARFLASGTATTDAYAVEIAQSATGGALNVSSGYATFAEGAHIAGGYFTDFTTVTDSTDNTGSFVYTPAMMLGGFITRDGIDADRTDDTATATAIVAAIPGCVNGSSFRFHVFNEDTTHNIIISNGVDVTIDGGDITLDTDEMVELLAVVTDAATEAVTIYNLGIRVIAQT